MFVASLPIQVDRDKLAEFSRSHGIRRMSLFGSVLRDDFDRSRSDVDVFVEYHQDHVPGWEFVTHAEELERILGHKVDYCTRLGQRLREHPGFTQLTNRFRGCLMSWRDPKLTLQPMRDYAEQAKELAASTPGRRIVSQRRSQPS